MSTEAAGFEAVPEKIQQVGPPSAPILTLRTPSAACPPP